MVVYGIIGFIRPAIYIFLLPFYLRVFSEDETGLYFLMIDVAGLAMLVIGFRLSSSMLTFYYNYFQEKEKVKEYLKSSYSASILMSALFLIVLYFIGPTIFDLVFEHEEVQFFPYGFTVCVYAALAEINMIYFVYLRNEKDLLKYSLIVVIQTFSVVMFQVILICIFNMGVQGALLGMALGWILVTLIVLLMERNILTLSPNWDMVKASLRFSIALIPYLIIYWLMMQGGKFFLQDSSTLKTVGLYGVLIVLTRLIILGVEAIVNGIRPFLYEQFAEKGGGDKAQISLLMRMVINIPLLAIPAVILVGTNLHYLTPQEGYYKIGQYMTLGCLVVFIFVYVKLFYQQLLFAKKSGLVTLLSLIAVFFLVAGFVYFIPTYEIWGVLYATLIGNFVLAILFFIAAQKVLPVSYSFSSIFLTPLLAFGAIFSLEYAMTLNGFSLSQFGMVQFILVSGLILGLNWSNVLKYKSIFMKNKLHHL